MAHLAQHRRHRAPVSTVVILLIDQKRGDGNNRYYSESSHSKLPRYDEKSPPNAPIASPLAESLGNTSTVRLPNDSKLVRLDCVKAMAKAVTEPAATWALPLPAHGGKRETLDQVFSICELAHSVRSAQARQYGSMEGFSHDRIREATHNRRRDNPGYWIGNLDRTGLCRRIVVLGGLEDPIAVLLFSNKAAPS